jgi:quercetin dioxygenase-like cupin family protein
VPFFDPSNMIEIEPVAGWKGRALHGERMTLVSYSIDAGAPDVHEHHHPQEEAWSVLEGELAIWVDGEERTLHPGDVAVIPPDVRHRVRALTASRALVVDSPARRALPGGPPRS